MTREERDKTIRILQWLHDNNFLFRSTEEDVKFATEYAIRALEQEPFINKTCVSSEVCYHDKNKVLNKIRAEILEEKECAYADFEQYKVDYLGVDAEYAEDELPQDDFRYGMERAVEIIDKYKVEG